MKNSKTYAIAVIAVFLLVYCSKNNNDQMGYKMIPKTTEQELAAKYFAALPKIAENKENLGNADKIYLGKVLFHDAKLSKTGNNSCNSCHNLETYGVDNQSFSTGDNGGKGGRNAPTVFNAAAHFVQFWDGRAKDVEEQAGGPVMNPAEMAMTSETEVVDRLKKTNYYLPLFQKAFPEDKDPVNFANMKKAIASFERTLMTKSKFDDFLGDNSKALTSAEITGMKTFIDTGCITCHSGATVGGQMYQKFGIFYPYQQYTKSKKIDNGRVDVTKNEADKFIFKVMSLRNIEKTAPYFHDGSVSDLKSAVKIMAKVQLNKDLTDQKVDEIVTFLKTLTADIPTEAKAIPKELASK